MSGFMFQNAQMIGQYWPTGSVIHRLDARIRLVAGLLWVIVLTLTRSLFGVGFGVIWIWLMLLIARIPIRLIVRRMLAPLPFLLVLAAIQALFGSKADAAKPLLSWGPFFVSCASIRMAGMLISRFLALFLTLNWMSFCLSRTDIVRALEKMLHPFNLLGLPTYDLVLTVQVTLHFVPLLLREAERIAKSQASRGAEWGVGRGGLLRRAKQALPLLIPLFLITLQRAETLAQAIEARSYGSGRRTSMVALRYQRRDGVALLAALISAAAMVLL